MLVFAGLLAGNNTSSSRNEHYAHLGCGHLCHLRQQRRLDARFRAKLPASVVCVAAEPGAVVGGGPVALQCDTADREAQHETGVARAGFQVKLKYIEETNLEVQGETATKPLSKS